MIELLVACRTPTDWLNDPTNGLNARLLAQGVFTGDAQPTPLALIADETRNSCAAFERVPDKNVANQYPCCLISQAMPIDVDPYPKATVAAQRDSEVEILLRLAQRQVDAAKGSTDACYWLGALDHCLNQFLFDANAASRTMSAAGLSAMVWFSMARQVKTLWHPIEDAIVTGAMSIRFKMRNTAP